jgi:hypothetical protein
MIGRAGPALSSASLWKASAMKKLWFVLLFFAGGISHEIRNPISCQCITARPSHEPVRRRSLQP